MHSTNGQDLQKSRTMRLRNSFWQRFTALAQRKGITRTALFIELVEAELNKSDDQS